MQLNEILDIVKSKFIDPDLSKYVLTKVKKSFDPEGTDDEQKEQVSVELRGIGCHLLKIAEAFEYDPQRKAD